MDDDTLLDLLQSGVDTKKEDDAITVARAWLEDEKWRIPSFWELDDCWVFCTVLRDDATGREEPMPSCSVMTGTIPSFKLAKGELLVKPLHPFEDEAIHRIRSGEGRYVSC